MLTFTQTLTEKDLQKIVKLHQQQLSESILNNFSTTFLYEVYDYFNKSPEVLLIGVKDKNNLIGFVTVLLNNQNIIQKILTKKPSLIGEVVKTLIKKPSLVLLLINNPDLKETTELQFIAVDKANQKKGIGTKMLNKIKVILKEKRIEKMVVGTKANNNVANNFYQKNGFKLLNQQKVGTDLHTFYETNIY